MNDKIIIKRRCPFCNDTTSDFLEHIRLSHDIDSVEEFDEKLAELEAQKGKQQAYRNYIEELLEKEKRREISAEDYRRLLTEWLKQHKT
ncbi:MAG: hypothetical protein ACREA3_08235 [Nitrosotalea sp.]